MPSLYANLLDPKANNAATISGAPVKYEFKKAEEPIVEEKKQDASLRFQPVKRPGVAQKPKPRPSAGSLPNAPKLNDESAPERKVTAIGTDPTSTIDRWTTADDEYDEDPYAAEYNRRMDEARRAQRAGKKKKKKGKVDHEVDWDRIYDPERPTRLDEYHGSEEQVQAAHDWKMRLHAHQMHRRSSRRSFTPSSDDEAVRRAPRQAFAPPKEYNFAPPSFDDRLADKPVETYPVHDHQSPQNTVGPVAQRQAAADDASGEEAYQRRLQMGATASASGHHPIPSTSITQPDPIPPPPPSDQGSLMALPQIVPAPGTSGSAVPASQPRAPTAGATLSAAPVRYSQPEVSVAATNEQHHAYSTRDAPASINEHEDADDLPRSSRPGQRGFAKRLLQKYGWTEGQGLGASNDGIVSILSHQKSKRKKRSDAEGGGWVGPAGGIARIVGGKRRKVDNAEDDGAGSGDEADAAGEKDQKWSIVVVLSGMLAGIDVQQQMSEGSLMQDIGDVMDKFGVVERLFIEPSSDGVVSEGPRVFVKFTSALSAYRAIQASDGNDFLANGRTVRSAFFDADKFEAGEY